MAIVTCTKTDDAIPLGTLFFSRAALSHSREENAILQYDSQAFTSQPFLSQASGRRSWKDARNARIDVVSHAAPAAVAVAGKVLVVAAMVVVAVAVVFRWRW